MSDETRLSPAATSTDAIPRNLTHCCECDQPFPEPVENWDDYFVQVEDASFACGPCGEREGYPNAE